jgi:nucleotide-binding universal stress UspA family protein
MIDRILVALDGSKLAEQALPVASGLAAGSGAELLLMTTIAPVERWVDSKESSIWEEEETAMAGEYLDSAARPLRDDGERVRTRVIWGRPAPMICEMAEEESADLIVMTTHGRSGIARWVMGSVADKVLRTSRQPVLLVRSRDEAAQQTVQLKKILVPLDGSPLSEAVLPFVGSLALRLGASLLLERVILPATALYAGEYVPSGLPALDELEAQARQYLVAIAKRERRRGITVDLEVDIGYAAEAILDAAERNKADLIALSTHGRSGPERWIMGSVADAVVRHADLPCLVLPVRATEAPHSGKRETVNAAVGSVATPPPTVLETREERTRTSARPPQKRAHRPESRGRQFR